MTWDWNSRACILLDVVFVDEYIWFNIDPFLSAEVFVHIFRKLNVTIIKRFLHIVDFIGQVT